MRTTLTLDDDVAAVLERKRRERDVSLKELVNEALRLGLGRMGGRRRRRAPVRTLSVNAGRCLIVGVDDVGEALAVAEGERFK